MPVAFSPAVHGGRSAPECQASVWLLAHVMEAAAYYTTLFPEILVGSFNVLLKGAMWFWGFPLPCNVMALDFSLCTK